MFEASETSETIHMLSARVRRARRVSQNDPRRTRQICLVSTQQPCELRSCSPSLGVHYDDREKYDYRNAS
jgi:hypothetical protein